MKNTKNTMLSWSKSLTGLFVGLAIVISAIIIANTLKVIKLAERYVTVRGLSEREVNADLAIWPITFNEVSNDLTSLQNTINGDVATVVSFLQQEGFPLAEISPTAPKIRDVQAEGYSGQNSRFRYVAQVVVLVRSKNIELVKKSMERAGILVSKGIVLSDNWENRTEFLFSGLNDIKPSMIEEATKNAREAANQFASDSKSKVGKIRRASQGLFSIEDADSRLPEKKIVRVVNSVDFYLKD